MRVSMGFCKRGVVKTGEVDLMDGMWGGIIGKKKRKSSGLDLAIRGRRSGVGWYNTFERWFSRDPIDLCHLPLPRPSNPPYQA